MGWQVPLILLCTHLACLGFGCWLGEGSLRRYKNQLYRSLYSGSHFKNPHRRSVKNYFQQLRGSLK